MRGLGYSPYFPSIPVRDYMKLLRGHPCRKPNIDSSLYNSKKLQHQQVSPFFRIAKIHPQPTETLRTHKFETAPS